MLRSRRVSFYRHAKFGARATSLRLGPAIAGATPFLAMPRYIRNFFRWNFDAGVPSETACEAPGPGPVELEA
jgi:hypothetical protein